MTKDDKTPASSRFKYLFGLKNLILYFTKYNGTETIATQQNMMPYIQYTKVANFIILLPTLTLVKNMLTARKEF